MITGTGGKSLSSIDPTDPQAGYFRAWMAGNINPTWGVSQFTISATQLTEQFVAASGGNFTDSFTITNSNVSPTPSTTLTPSPSPTSGTLLAQDTFQRPNQTFWGTASDGHVWAGDANSLGNFSIVNNDAGQIAATTTRGYSALLGPTVTDAEVVFSGSISGLGSTNLASVLRWTNSNNYYKAYINGSKLVLVKKVSGTLTQLASTAFTAASGTSYTLRFNVTGSTLSAKVWQTGTSEPSNWMLTATDNSLSSGSCGLFPYLASGVTASITSFQATAQ